MVNLTIINKENLPVPTFLSTSTWVIYDDKPPTFYQGSTIHQCDEILIAFKQCDRGGDFSYFLSTTTTEKCQAYVNTFVRIFQLLKKQHRFKHIKKFTLETIEFHLSSEYVPPNLYSTNMVYMFCAHRFVEDVYLNIVFILQPNLFTII